jgi:S-formylglutathione hydrolase FrmB
MTIQTVSLNISHGGMQGGLARFSDLLADYGDVDPFLAEQLRPELLQGACEKANIPLKLRRLPCYS